MLSAMGRQQKVNRQDPAPLKLLGNARQANKKSTTNL